MKKSKDTIGNQTHDLPACCAVPQPTAPLHAPVTNIFNNKSWMARQQGGPVAWELCVVPTVQHCDSVFQNVTQAWTETLECPVLQ